MKNTAFNATTVEQIKFVVQAILLILSKLNDNIHLLMRDVY
uniref:Uncharacterized protein n=1 Tax=virus sp. ct5rm7 TaxID=2827298 RepID=A0A8S5RGR9_9VIRU|nr:MAG TPA: hypothetical protein [virus sp. ct5rm7]